MTDPKTCYSAEALTVTVREVTRGTVRLDLVARAPLRVAVTPVHRDRPLAGPPTWVDLAEGDRLTVSCIRRPDDDPPTAKR